MSENRLETIDSKLSKRLKQVPSRQLRIAALAVFEAALERIGLRDPTIDKGLEALRSERDYDPQLRKQVKSLVERLDEIQWNLQDMREEGNASESQYLAAFSQARIANALYFALDRDAYVAATETIYEANAAVDDLEGLKKIISSILNEVI